MLLLDHVVDQWACVLLLNPPMRNTLTPLHRPCWKPWRSPCSLTPPPSPPTWLRSAGQTHPIPPASNGPISVRHTLIKKKIKFSSYIRKFRVEQLQSHIRLTASSYKGKYLSISSNIRKAFLIYDFATAPLWISLYMRKIWFSFLSVYMDQSASVFLSQGPVVHCAISSAWPELDLRFRPWLLLFWYWTDGSDLSSSLCVLPRVSRVTVNEWEEARGSQRDIVYLGWPTSPS